MTRPAIRVIVLAAQRNGVADPLATRFGVSHKCLAPLRGRPLISHVFDAIEGCDAIASVAVSVEADHFGPIRALFPSSSRSAFKPVAALDNIADSVRAAANGHHGPVIITTADNALLRPESVRAVADALARHDAVFAMARREEVLAAHALGQRRFYRFRDAEYSNCNLYGLADPRALDAAEIFRGGGQFAKRAGRMVKAFGLLNLILLRLRLLTLGGAARRISRRIGFDLSAVVLSDGSQAIDVDNDRTYAVVEELLMRRETGASAWSEARPELIAAA